MSVRSPMGSARWNLLVDSEGNRIKPPDRSLIGTTMRAVHETPPHALSSPTVVSGDDEEKTRIEREAQAQWDALGELTREVARLSMLRLGVLEQNIPFPATQRADKERLGWFFVRELPRRRGISMVLMVRNQVKTLSPLEIGERVGKTEHQVKRILNRIPRALYAMAERRNWP